MNITIELLALGDAMEKSAELTEEQQARRDALKARRADIAQLDLPVGERDPEALSRLLHDQMTTRRDARKKIESNLKYKSRRQAADANFRSMLSKIKGKGTFTFDPREYGIMFEPNSPEVDEFVQEYLASPRTSGLNMYTNTSGTGGRYIIQRAFGSNDIENIAKNESTLKYLERFLDEKDVKGLYPTREQYTRLYHDNREAGHKITDLQERLKNALNDLSDSKQLNSENVARAAQQQAEAEKALKALQAQMEEAAGKATTRQNFLEGRYNDVSKQLEEMTNRYTSTKEGLEKALEHARANTNEAIARGSEAVAKATRKGRIGMLGAGLGALGLGLGGGYGLSQLKDVN